MSFEEWPDDPSLRDPLPASPLSLLWRWFDEARSAGRYSHPEAMTLATVGLDGRPSARVVLCRGYDAERGFLVFYTNRRSKKGRDLDVQPLSAAVFYWDGMRRQARVEGPVTVSPEEESDAYFAGRPRPSQISAWASEQSEPIASRRALLDRHREVEERFSGAEGPQIPRPPHWGGYRLWLERVELWVGSAGRAHDRALWTRRLEPDDGGYAGGAWSATRLQP